MSLSRARWRRRPATSLPCWGRCRPTPGVPLAWHFQAGHGDRWAAEPPDGAGWGLPPKGAVPQRAEDLALWNADLEAGCESGVYEVVHEDEAEDLIRRGHLVSSMFTV